MTVGYADVLEALQDNHYKVFNRPYELNIIGIRANSVVANTFNDILFVFYYDEKGGIYWDCYQITTDPGTYWLVHPLDQRGTAILLEGQYLNAYQIGLHRNLYKALVQVGPVDIVRDYNRNAILDFQNGNIDHGFFGINIHRGAATGVTRAIDKTSAGCQVFEMADDFAKFMWLCNRHSQLHGNIFSYTLIDMRMARRRLKRRALYFAGATSLALTTAFIARKIVQNDKKYLPTTQGQKRRLQSA